MTNFTYWKYYIYANKLVKYIINNYSWKSLIGKYKFPRLREGKNIDVWLGKFKIGKGIISIKKEK